MTYKYSQKNRPIVIVGLDGVVCDNSARRKAHVPNGLANASELDFARYNAEIPFDLPISETFGHIHRKFDFPFFVFVTDRPDTEKNATATKEWLSKFLKVMGEFEYKTDYVLMMRPPGRKDRAERLILSMMYRVQEGAAEGAKIVAAYSSMSSVGDALYGHPFPSYFVSWGGGGRGWVISSVGAVGKSDREAARTRGSAVDDEFPFDRDQSSVKDARTEEQKVSERRAFVDTPKVAEKGVEGDVIGSLMTAMETLKSRKEVYGKSDRMTGAIMAILFPDGIKLTTPEDHRMFHFLGHAVNKLVRFASSGLQHADSAHDLINYAAFLETLAGVHQIKVNNGK